MKAFFKDIFEYQHHFNQILANVFAENKEKISSRTVSLFSHVINAHQIWNARILGGKPLGVHQLHSLEDCKRLDHQNFKDTLEILDKVDLQKNINYTNSKGKNFSNSVQEILFHISNHSTHHKGQLISDLRSCGMEPPVTDYIFYKR